MPDPIDDTFERLEDLVVPEPENSVAIRRDGATALLVMGQGAFSTMLAAVEFDDKLRIVASEIGDIACDGHLAAEVASL